MIWVVVFIVIGIISFFLTLRSMKDYQEKPAGPDEYGLFHLSKNTRISSELLKELHTLFAGNKLSFSIEKLVKGSEEAVIIYLPKDMAGMLPQLHLVEIEDYLKDIKGKVSESWILNKQIDINHSFTLFLHPVKGEQAAKLHLKGINPDGLTGFQCVLESVKNGEETVFQSTMRLIVEEKEDLKRVELVKNLKTEVIKPAGLSAVGEVSNIKNFTDYKSRIPVPIQVDKKLVDSESLAMLFS